VAVDGGKEGRKREGERGKEERLLRPAQNIIGFRN
jgi:hypothetical protein